MNNLNKILGLFFMAVGLIFIICPMFSSEVASAIVGLSLLFFGIASIVNAYSTLSVPTYFTTVNVILGIISIIFGILFIFFIDGLSFLVGFQFYIVGLIMIIFGILGLISESLLSKTTSALILIIGIVAIALAVFTVEQPIYAAILIGVCLLVEGIGFFLND